MSATTPFSFFCHAKALFELLKIQIQIWLLKLKKKEW